MPDFLTKNLSTFITIAVISISGIVSFAILKNDVAAIESRVNRLETSNENVVLYLNRIDKKLALLLCRMDNTACNLKD